MLKKILKFLRIINKKTFDIQLFLIPTHIRAKIQILLLCFFPNFINLLSIKGAKLPTKDEKFNLNSKNSKKLNECIILNKRNFKEKKINLFIRFKEKKYLNFKNQKIFLLNPLIVENEIKSRLTNIDSMKLEQPKNKNVIYVTAEHTLLKKFFKANVNILYIQTWKNSGTNFYLEKYEKSDYKKALNYCKNKKHSFVVDIAYNTTCATIYTSSAVAAAAFFAKSCDQVKIYDWNFYLKKNPKNLSFLKRINLLYPTNFRLKNNVFLETSLWHWYFIYRLTNLKNVSITGNLKYIINDKKIIKILKKLFCK